MIFGLLLIIFILYGLLLFWVLYERLKNLAFTARKTSDSVKRIEEKLALVVDFLEENEKSREGGPLGERFTLEALKDERGIAKNTISEGDER
ncbi:MAG TPA: hypothetical protein VLH40_01680 [Atribacteraceae bacterium]|nr:hypothetical protein [Atribacteraceae bacterium]